MLSVASNSLHSASTKLQLSRGQADGLTGSMSCLCGFSAAAAASHREAQDVAAPSLGLAAAVLAFLGFAFSGVEGSSAGVYDLDFQVGWRIFKFDTKYMLFLGFDFCGVEGSSADVCDLDFQGGAFTDFIPNRYFFLKVSSLWHLDF